MKARQASLFESERLQLEDAIELSLDSLREYGQRYRHWAVAYSGGKDSSATVTFVAWAIKSGRVPAPESLTALYADTRQEYPPLHATAMQLLEHLRRDSFQAHVVLPELDNRFYVYMLGYGVPPPSNRFRWCTPKLKIEPMMQQLQSIRGATGEKFLMVTGVRLGESEARDKRIAIACNKDTGECGTGWIHVENAGKEDKKAPGMWVRSPENAPADTLAPLLHWRVCHVFDWLYFNQHRHGYPEVAGIADVYGDEDVRTGCIGCPLASRDVALKNLVKRPQWSHLTPLLELKPMFREMKGAQWRKRKAVPEQHKDGKLSKNGQRKGPLTMEARAYWLDRVLDVQRRAGVDLINAEEKARILEMWQLDLWPQKWSGNDIRADIPIDRISVIGGKTIVQPLLVR